MPITIKKMAENTATISMNWGEDTVNVDYFPSQVTEETIAELDQEGFETLNKVLARMVKSWDVLDEDGSMFPIDVEHLATLPLKFRLTLARAIIRDIRPNE